MQTNWKKLDVSIHDDTSISQENPYGNHYNLKEYINCPFIEDLNQFAPPYDPLEPINSRNIQ